MKNLILKVIGTIILFIAYVITVFFFGSPKHLHSSLTYSESYDQKKADSLIYIATLYEGHKEETPNNSPLIRWWLYKLNIKYPAKWCAAYASHCLDSAGIANPRNPWVDAWAYGIWRFRVINNSDPNFINRIRPGDIFLLYSKSMKRHYHIGFILEIHKDYVITIEGNTNEKGSSNGCCVMKRKRSIESISKILRLCI
jgi:hypothetical protein